MFTLTPLLMIDKKREKYLVYICIFFLALFTKGRRIFVYAYYFVLHITLFCKEEKRIWCVSCLFMHVYLLVFAYMFMSFHIYLYLILKIFSCFKAQSMFMLSFLQIFIFNWFLNWYFYISLCIIFKIGIFIDIKYVQ